jgi:glycosyltransferase involved in cell wall biosynthesis
MGRPLSPSPLAGEGRGGRAARAGTPRPSPETEASSADANRVAFVWPGTIWDDHLTKEFLIARTLRELRIDVQAYCVKSLISATEVPIVEVTLQDLASAEFWRREGVRRAIVCTWTMHPEVIRALRAAGASVISKCDTNGDISVRRHPLRHLKRMVLLQETAAGRAFAVREWLACLGPRHRREMGLVVDSYDAATAVVVESEPARAAYLRLLRQHHGHPDPDRVHAVLNPVGRHFTRAALPPEKERLVVALGRWEHPAKHAGRMAETLRRFLAHDRAARAVVVGRCGEAVFSALEPDRLRYLGPVPNEALVDVYARARVLVSCSRWEGAPIAPNEALAMGCTVVAPALPAYRYLAESGPFATLAPSRTARSLSAALAREFAAWDAGARNAAEIADRWRPRVDCEAVVRRLLELLD